MRPAMPSVPRALWSALAAAVPRCCVPALVAAVAGQKLAACPAASVRVLVLALSTPRYKRGLILLCGVNCFKSRHRMRILNARIDVHLYQGRRISWA